MVVKFEDFINERKESKLRMENPDLYDDLVDLMRNDGDSYKAKDAKKAFTNALKDHIKFITDRIKEDADIMKKDIISDVDAYYNGKD